MIEPDAVIAQAREWLGVRFLHQGRNRFGCDCSGFFAGLMHELGSDEILDRLPRAYSRSGVDLIPTLEQLSRPIELQPAALIAVQWPQTKNASHVALYTGTSVIHATEGNGKVVEHGYVRQWVDRTVSIWALPLVVYR